MNEEIRALIDALSCDHTLEQAEYERLIEGYSPEAAAYLARLADEARRQVYGNSVYIRGLIEVSSVCRNDCLYCGIRRSNAQCGRYRLTQEDILSCCFEGYALGFRTFVLQGGEDGALTDDWLCGVVGEIKRLYPDCAVTLSVGERSRESYQRLHDAGADRYLLRHETADAAHYARLHPEAMSFDNRMRCLSDLRETGYQVGCGFMVGSPYQTAKELACDMKFIERFQPDMCGIGPFIPHSATPFAAFPAGTAQMTCYLLSMIRLICPHALLPATTALGAIVSGGREMGIRAGANVVMPNLTPDSVKGKYDLYAGKAQAESARELNSIRQRMKEIGYEVVSSRGDVQR